MGRRAEEPASKAGKAIWKALERIERDGHSRDRLFTDWLDLMLCAYLSLTKHTDDGKSGLDHQNSFNDEYMAIVARYPSDRPMGARPIDYFQQAFGALVAGALEDDGDPLGDVFMSAISFGEHGQYFTPYHLSAMMAKLTMPEISTHWIGLEARIIRRKIYILRNADTYGRQANMLNMQG